MSEFIGYGIAALYLGIIAALFWVDWAGQRQYDAWMREYRKRNPR